MRKISKALALVFCVIMLISSLGAVSFAAAKKPAATKKISTTVSDTSIKLTWSKVSGASGYRVYQYKNKEWAVIKSSTTSNTYTIKSLKPATSYKFAVKTYKKSGSKTTWSDAKKITVKTAAVSNPKTVKATAGENCKVTLKWSKVSGATGYVAYVYKDNAWKKLKATSGTSYTATGLNANTTYKFKVVAYKKISDKNYYSSGKTASVKTGALSVGKISSIDVGATSNAVTLSWSAEGNINGYRVYIYDKATDSYKTLATIKDTTYTATGLSGSTTYTFVVKPYAKSGSTTVWGAKTTVIGETLLTAPGTISATVEGQTATIVWSTAGNADGYRVYLFKDVASDSYSVLQSSTTDTSYVYEIPKNTMQKIGVKAFRKLDNGEYDWSSMKVITVGGIYKYKTLFDSGVYSYTTVIDGQETTVYHKNGSVNLTTKMPITEKIMADCQIIYNAKEKKSIALISIAGMGGFYCTDLAALGGDDIDISETGSQDARFSSDDIATEIVVTEVNYEDKTLICESFYNSNGENIKFYFDEGAFVKHEIVSTRGVVDAVVLKDVKNSVSDKKFNVTPPWNYINIDAFLEEN